MGELSYERWTRRLTSQARDDNDGQPLLHRGKAPEPPRNRFQAFFAHQFEKAKPTLQAINQFMTVPMWAALVSIFIAMIPPLQKFLGRLEPLEKAIKGAGQCSSMSVPLPR